MGDLCSAARGGSHAMCVLAGMTLVALAIVGARYLPRLARAIAAAGLALAASA
jgi:hypothetical protein